MVLFDLSLGGKVSGKGRKVDNPQKSDLISLGEIL